MISRRINRFRGKFQNTKLEDYFGIKNVKFHFVVEENEILLTIHAIKIYPCYNILELPKDINLLIASYNLDSLVITLKITFGDRYPFYPPIWELVDVNSNISTHISLVDYYGYLVENHNKTNKDWSPIVSIETDILGFIDKNDFEYMFESG